MANSSTNEKDAFPAQKFVLTTAWQLGTDLSYAFAVPHVPFLHTLLLSSIVPGELRPLSLA